MLDFVDIKEEGLAEKLTDEDIGGILVCIDAKNNLKKLRLTRCSKVVGHGLDPVRGSVVLEDFDASTIATRKWENGSYRTVKSISAEAVVPILDSIIDADGNSLRELSLPQDWKEGTARNEPPLREFFAKFNQLMQGKELECAHCHELCRGDGETLSCEICCKNRNCDGCVEYGVPMDVNYPFVRSCDHCDQMLCSSCGSHSICEGCGSAFCSLCADIDDVDAGAWCGGQHCYSERMCLGCRMPESPADLTDCESCRGLVAPKLAEDNERLRNEVEQLSQVDEENKQLRKENDEMRKKFAALGILA